MYSLLIKLKIIFVFGLLLFSLGNMVLGDELTDDIYSVFKKQFDGGMKNAYLEAPYSSSFPKDPFLESFDDIEDMSRQLKIAGTEYIEKVLSEDGCSLSKKKIRSLLYYFVPEFRTEITQALKLGLGDYSTKNFVFDNEKIVKYCNEYFACKEYNGEEDDETYLERVTRVTEDTSKNLITNCKEFFQENYNIGKDFEDRTQKLQVSQIAFDKYWNATTDDSPYDIMSDFGSIGRLLYTDAEQPITPVFYQLPVFSNSVNLLNKHEENGSSYDNSGKSGNKNGGNSLGQGGVGGQFGSNGGNGSSVDPLPLPLSRSVEGFSMEDGYDDLVEGLGGLTAKQSDSQFYGSLCDDLEEELLDKYDDKPDVDSTSLKEPDLSEFSDEGLQKLVDYMTSAVDKYASLPEEKQEEMKKKAGNTSSFVGDTTANQLEKTANRIRNCWKSCEGLRIDQYASCLIMCSCGEIKSSDDPINLFDSEKFPGLGPIFVIRFCAVPGTNIRFDKGGKKIVSIEEGVNEIYGVVDKLSREGRLGMWTQQYNFLDSSTKRMNMADSVSFSIDIEFVDIADSFPKHSEQYVKKELKNSNDSWQRDYHISNNLEDPLYKNYYALLAKTTQTSDVSTQSNAEWTRQSQGNLSVESSSMINLNSDSRASHYSKKSQLFDKWLEQQSDLWIETLKYLNSFNEKTEMLDSKTGPDTTKGKGKS